MRHFTRLGHGTSREDHNVITDFGDHRLALGLVGSVWSLAVIVSETTIYLGYPPPLLFLR